MSPVLLLVLFVGAILVTGAARRYALRSEMVDHPNHRSSHTTPTPRGGGISLALGWIVGLTIILPSFSDGLGLALLLGGTVVALAGWLDDHGRATIRVRLVMQFAAAIALVVVLGGPDTVNLGVVEIPLGLTAVPLAVLGVVWAINAWNFMDGIDGLAGSQSVISSLAFGFIISSAGGMPLAMVAWILAASALGFLLWNLPPARIFMGDVGSGLLGFAAGALVLAGPVRADVPLLIMLLPTAPFFGDATFTLVARAIRGERVALPHRRHLYQRVVQAGWSHRRVTAIYAATAAVMGLIAAWGAAEAARTALALATGWGLVLTIGILLSRKAVPMDAAPGSQPAPEPYS